MIRFLRAHGADPGPTQRPLTAGLVTGLAATAPAGGTLIAFGSFAVAADQVIRLSAPVTAALLIAAFATAGLLYGALFQRAANDRRAGWLLGLAYGFVLWVAAPMVVLPLVSGVAMAAGVPAKGFLITFLFWGLVLGTVFPYVHARLHRGLQPDRRVRGRLGADAAALKRRLFRRPV